MPIINQVVKGGGGSAPAHYIEKTVDANGILKNTSLFINLNGVKDISVNCFRYAFANSLISSADMSSIESLTGANCCDHAFDSCEYLTSADLSSLTTINGNSVCTSMFSNCINLTSMNFPSLTSITGSTCCNSMFQYDTKMTELNFPVLKSINTSSCMAAMCSGCNILQTVRFSSLDVIADIVCPSYSNMFSNCFLLKDVYFGGLKSTTFANKTNQIQYLFNNTTGRDEPNGCTIHFPSNFDPSDPNHTFDASTLAGYPTFGGSANYIHVAFDLPPTE